VEFCKKCDAYVEVYDIENNGEIQKGMCRCCGSNTIKNQKKTWLTRVLKAGIRQHHNVLRDWSAFPDGCRIDEIKPRSYTDLSGKRVFVREVFSRKPRGGQFVEIKYNSTVYEISLKYLALYLEPLIEEEKLKIINKKIGIKGYRITYPTSEEMDERCITCRCKLRYTLQNEIYCPECNGKQD
jgi:hypothetical protein